MAWFDPLKRVHLLLHLPPPQHVQMLCNPGETMVDAVTPPVTRPPTCDLSPLTWTSHTPPNQHTAAANTTSFTKPLVDHLIKNPYKALEHTSLKAVVCKEEPSPHHSSSCSTDHTDPQTSVTPPLHLPSPRTPSISPHYNYLTPPSHTLHLLTTLIISHSDFTFLSNNPASGIWRLR